MRILFATPYKKQTGGITRWAEYIVNASMETDSCVKLDVLPMNPPTASVEVKGFCQRASVGIRTYCAVLQELKKRLKKDSYDLLHIASSASISLFKDILMIRLAKRSGVKTVLHFHFGRIPELAAKRNWEWRLLYKAVRMSDKTIVIDRLSYDTLIAAGCDNVEFLPNPLSPQVDVLLQKNGKTDRKPRTLLFAGHVIPTKGVYELVDACRQITNVELRVLGAVTSEMRQALMSKVDDAKWLHIIGQKSFEEVVREMCCCDLFVLPTYTEGFPNVILESMACGCPIITTPVGAIPEMLNMESDEPCGVCVGPQCVEELKGAIETLLDDEIQKKEMSQRAYKRVRQMYSLDSVWHQMQGIWNTTIK